jgi:hypothetical protein
MVPEGEGPVTSKSTSSLLSSSDQSTEEKKKERRKKLGQSKSLADISTLGEAQTTSKSKSVSSLTIPPTNSSSSLSPRTSTSLKHRSHSDADIRDPHGRKSVSFSSEVEGRTKIEDDNLTNSGGQSVPFPAFLVPQSSMGQMIALAGRNRSRSEEEMDTSSFGNKGLWEGMNHLDFNTLGAGGLGECAEAGGHELWPPTAGSLENPGTTPRATLAPRIIIEQPSPHTSHSKLDAQGTASPPPASFPTPSATPSPGHSQPPSPRAGVTATTATTTATTEQGVAGGGKKTNIAREDLEMIEKSSIRRLRVVEREETRKAMLFDIFNGSSLPRVEILHGNFTLDLLNSADCLVLPIPLNPTMGPTPFIKAIAALLGEELLPLIRRVYNKGFGAIPPNDTTLIPLFSTGVSQEGEDKQTCLVHLAPRLAGLTPWSSLPSPLKVAPKLSYLLCVGVWKHENSTRKEVFVRDAFRSALMEVDAHNFRMILSQGEEEEGGGERKTRKSLDGGLFASQNRFIGELLSPHFLLKEMTRPEVTGENMALAYLAYCKSKRWLDSGAHLTHGDFSKALISGNLCEFLFLALFLLNSIVVLTPLFFPL